jgi:hypothetical protein
MLVFYFKLSIYPTRKYSEGGHLEVFDKNDLKMLNDPNIVH